MGNEVKEKEENFQMQKGRLLLTSFYEYLKTERNLYKTDYTKQPSVKSDNF